MFPYIPPSIQFSYLTCSFIFGFFCLYSYLINKYFRESLLLHSYSYCKMTFYFWLTSWWFFDIVFMIYIFLVTTVFGKFKSIMCLSWLNTVKAPPSTMDIDKSSHILCPLPRLCWCLLFSVIWMTWAALCAVSRVFSPVFFWKFVLS